MLLEPCLTTLKNLGLLCGSPEESWSLALPSGHQSTPRRVSRGSWRTNVCCGRPSQPSLTCNAHGKSSFSARIQEETTQFAPCHQGWLWSMRGLTTKGSGTRRFGSLPTSQEVKPNGSVHESWQACLLRMGGLGLRSMSRCSRAAYWASWADALPMIQERNPAIAEIVENALVHNVFPPEGCLSELVQATSQLDQEGFSERPSWSELAGASDRPRTCRRNPASGSTAGSIGHLPPPIVPLGRAPCCQASLPQTGHIFGPTQGAMQVWYLHTHRQLPSWLSLHICSGCCSWRGCASPCRSRRPRAVGAARHLILAVSTEPLAPGLGG